MTGHSRRIRWTVVMMLQIVMVQGRVGFRPAGLQIYGWCVYEF